jgi:hypothetical protein
LPGRVRVSRAAAERRRDSRPVPDKQADLPQSRLVCFIFRKVGQDGEIVFFQGLPRNEETGYFQMLLLAWLYPAPLLSISAQIRVR